MIHIMLTQSFRKFKIFNAEVKYLHNILKRDTLQLLYRENIIFSRNLKRSKTLIKILNINIYHSTFADHAM